VRQHLRAVSSSASALVTESPCDFPGAMTRDASDRLLPISRLRTSTRASSVLDASRRFRALRTRGKTCLFLRQCNSLRRVARGSPRTSHRGGRFLPVAMRADRASDIPVAPPALPVALARSEFREGRLGRFRPARVNERAAERPEMPSVWRRPLPRNALSGARLGPSPAPRLGHRGAGCRRLCTPSRLLAETARAGSLSTCPVASGKHASLGPRRRSPTSATDYDARTHPTSHRSSHASGAFAPLHAGTNRCQLRWPQRCVAAPWACEPPPAHAGFRTSRSACAEEAGHGPRHSSEGEPRALDDVARALLVVPRAPGSPARFFAESG
jgi:hypothetical protein